ncbi:MAG: hypothetical protein ISR64_06245 [Deltaproteobacteria bacterium]|nr:hypothetical protein [Deltaproteobacteria bacterium]
MRGILVSLTVLVSLIIATSSIAAAPALVKGVWQGEMTRLSDKYKYPVELYLVDTPDPKPGDLLGITAYQSLNCYYHSYLIEFDGTTLITGEVKLTGASYCPDGLRNRISFADGGQAKLQSYHPERGSEIGAVADLKVRKEMPPPDLGVLPGVWKGGVTRLADDYKYTVEFKINKDANFSIGSVIGVVSYPSINCHYVLNVIDAYGGTLITGDRKIAGSKQCPHGMRNKIERVNATSARLESYHPEKPNEIGARADLTKAR